MANNVKKNNSSTTKNNENKNVNNNVEKKSKSISKFNQNKIVETKNATKSKKNNENVEKKTSTKKNTIVSSKEKNENKQNIKVQETLNVSNSNEEQTNINLQNQNDLSIEKNTLVKDNDEIENQIVAFQPNTSLPSVLNGNSLAILSQSAANLPMNPEEYQKHLAEIKKVDERFKKILFWTLSGVASATIFFGGLAGMIHTAKSNEVNPKKNLENLVKITENFANYKLTYVAFQKDKDELTEIINQAKEILEKQPKNIKAFKEIYSSLYNRFLEALEFYNAKKDSIDKIQDFLDSEENNSLKETLYSYDEYVDLKEEYIKELNIINEIKNSLNRNLPKETYNDKLNNFITKINEIKDKKNARDLKVNAFNQLKTLYQNAKEWFDNLLFVHNEINNLMIDVLENTRANFIENSSVNVKSPNDKTKVVDITKQMQKLADNYLKAQKEQQKREDLFQYIRSLNNELEKDFKAKYFTYQNNIFTDLYNKHLIDFKSQKMKFQNFVDDLEINKNNISITNNDLEIQALKLHEELEKLKSNANALEVRLNNKKSQVNIIKKNIEKWIEIPEYWKTQPDDQGNTDENGFLTLSKLNDQDIYDKLGTQQSGLLFKTIQLIEKISNYSMLEPEIESQTNDLRTNFTNIKNEKIEKTRARTETINQLEALKEKILTNHIDDSSYNSQSPEHNKKRIFANLNNVYDALILNIKEKLNKQYSLSQIKEYQKEAKQNYTNYTKEVKEINDDLVTYRENVKKFKLVDPKKTATNGKKPVLEESDYQNYLPSEINDIIEATTSNLTSKHLKNFLHNEVQFIPNDESGKLNLKFRFYYEKIIYNNPNDITSGVKEIKKLYYEDLNNSNIQVEMKKFAFEEKDKLNFSIHNHFSPNYKDTQSVVEDLQSYVNNNITSDYIGKVDNEILGVDYDPNSKNKYKITSITNQDNATNKKIEIKYRILRQVVVGKKASNPNENNYTEYTETFTAEVFLDDILKTNNESSTIRKAQNRLKIAYEDLEKLISKKLDDKKDLHDLIKPLKDLLNEAKEYKEKDLTQILTTPDSEEAKEFVRKCNEFANQIIAKKKTTLSAKSAKNIALLQLEDELKLQKKLLNSILGTETFKADKKEADEITQNITNIEKVLKDDYATNIEEIKNTYNNALSIRQVNEQTFNQKNHYREILRNKLISIQSQANNTFIDIQIKEHYLTLTTNLINETNEAIKENDNTVEKIQKRLNDIQNHFEKEILTKYADTFELLEKLRDKIIKFINFKNTNLIEKKYAKYYLEEANKLLNKAKETTGEGITTSLTFDQIKTAYEYFEKEEKNINEKFSKFTKQRNELLNYIKFTMLKYVQGQLLTKDAEGLEPEIEGLTSQDELDIKTPLNTIINTQRNLMEQEPAAGKTIEQVYENIKKLLEEKLQEYKNIKIKKFNLKKDILKVIDERKYFIKTWLEGVNLIDVQPLIKIINDECNKALNAHNANTTTVESLTNALDALKQKTDITINESQYNLKDKWETLCIQLDQIIKNLANKYNFIKTQDKENINFSTTPGYDQELTIKNDDEFLDDETLNQTFKNLKYTNSKETFIKLQSLYNDLNSSIIRILSNKRSKINDRNSFLTTFKNAAYYYNEGISKNTLPAEMNKFRSHMNRIPEMEAYVRKYKTTAFINSNEDEFSIYNKTKMDQIRAHLDKNYKYYSSNSNIPTYKKAIQDLNEWIQEYIAYKDKLLRYAIDESNQLADEFDKLLYAINTEKQKDLRGNFYSPTYNEVSAIRNEYNTEKYQAQLTRDRFQIRKVANKYRDILNNLKIKAEQRKYFVDQIIEDYLKNISIFNETYKLENNDWLNKEWNYNKLYDWKIEWFIQLRRYRILFDQYRMSYLSDDEIRQAHYFMTQELKSKLFNTFKNTLSKGLFETLYHKFGEDNFNLIKNTNFWNVRDYGLLDIYNKLNEIIKPMFSVSSNHSNEFDFDNPLKFFKIFISYYSYKSSYYSLKERAELLNEAQRHLYWWSPLSTRCAANKWILYFVWMEYKENYSELYDLINQNMAKVSNDQLKDAIQSLEEAEDIWRDNSYPGNCYNN